MNNALVRLKGIFSENQVRNIADLRELSPKQFLRLDASVYGWFSAFRNETVRRLAEADGLNLCLGLRRNAEDVAVGAPMGMIIKKLTFFSQTGVIVTPKFSAPGRSRRAVPDSWYYLALNYLPLVETGALTILPKAVAYLTSESTIQGDGFIIKRKHPGVVKRDWFLLEEEIPSIRIVDLSERALRQQLVEAHAHYGVPSGQQAYIFLPHLANIPVELLSSVRQEHGDVFARYNRTIKTFFTSSARVTSEKKLLEVMRATDEGIRKVDADLAKISQSRVLQRAEVVLKAGVGVLCQFASNDYVKGLGSLLAGGSLISPVLKYFQLSAEKESIIASTPFYFPWLIHREATKFAPR